MTDDDAGVILNRFQVLCLATLLAVSPILLPGAGVDAGPRRVNHYETTPGVRCGPGSRPEGPVQGRVPRKDHESGRAQKGYFCNTQQVAKFGNSGGYRVHRYIDEKGHECAFFDSTLLYPTNAVSNTEKGPGVIVLDMSNPRKPVQTANLVTPAMQSPHESFSLNEKRGLIGAVMGYPTFQPGFVDIYSVKEDCRHPELMSSTPVGLIGHEGNFAPDGKTYWSSGIGILTAVDITDPRTPSVVAFESDYRFHGLNISNDGTRLYAADLGSNEQQGGPDGTSGLTILDVGEVQRRKPDPEIKFVSHLTWPTVSIPQTAIPVTIDGHPYVVEIDEFGGGATVGAGRIIDISDEVRPFIVSNLRLEVNNPDHQEGPQSEDPGASSGLQGYDGHYCAVPKRADPGIVACSFIVSGLRVFDIRDPYQPREIAYFNRAPDPNAAGYRGSYAMSGPAFAAERGEIWYTDGYSGFYNVKVTNDVWPFNRS
ncbi:MAG: LVIVD repeat-containing protein [Actinomycetota bacterium]